jgi:catechol 2,3-dioxygenase-like lactoylglutathione lyase family enzyme
LSEHAQMTRRIGYVTVLVRDYDEAIAFYTGAMGFELVEDTPLGGGKRWVLVRPSTVGTCLLLAEAANARQAARIGDQMGGRVFLFLHTDDLRRDYDRMKAAGVRFRETPRTEPYGVVAVFEDLYGNGWDLLQLNRDSAN